MAVNISKYIQLNKFLIDIYNKIYLWKRNLILFLLQQT